MEGGGRQDGEGQDAARDKVGGGQQQRGRLQRRPHELQEGVAQGTPQQPVAPVRDARHHVVRELEADESQRPVLLQQQRRHCLGGHPAHGSHTSH